MAKKKEGFFYNFWLTVWMIMRVVAFVAGIVAICLVLGLKWNFWGRISQFPFGIWPSAHVSFIPNLPHPSILVDNYRSKEKAEILMRKLRKQSVYARVHAERGVFFVYVDTFPTFSNTQYAVEELHRRGFSRARIVEEASMN